MKAVFTAFYPISSQGAVKDSTFDFATGFLLFYSSNTFRTFGVAVLAGSLGWHVDEGQLPFYCSRTQFVLENSLVRRSWYLELR